MPEVGGLVLAYLAEYAPENEQSKKIFSRINNDIEEMDKKTKKYLQNKFQKIFGIKNNGLRGNCT
jgi:predicted GTPase